MKLLAVVAIPWLIAVARMLWRITHTRHVDNVTASIGSVVENLHGTFTSSRLTAALDDAVTIASGDLPRRHMEGELVEYGLLGHTSVGPLRVAAGAIHLRGGSPLTPDTPADQLATVTLTREHNRGESRGVMVAAAMHSRGIRSRYKAGSGPEGDAALTEAHEGTRRGLSVDLVNVRIVGDTITYGELVAVGQVGTPAYAGMQIDRVAASATHTTQGEKHMTAEEIARLAHLRGLAQLTAAEAAELVALTTREAETTATATTDAGTPTSTSAPTAEPQQVAAGMPAIPAGINKPARPAVTTRDQGSALDNFVRRVVDCFRAQDRNVASVTAALADVTWGSQQDALDNPAWSGELWSGVAYESEFVPLINSGELTSWSGHGWRWVTKPELADYAGDKAAIPSAAIDTEPSTYEASRLAVGHDFDRKFLDFPDEGFLKAYLEAVRESWAMKIDAKVEAYLLATATVTAPATSGGGDLFKAATKLSRALKRAAAGRASWFIVNDADYDNLIDIGVLDVPAFLELFNLKPEQLVASANQVAGTITSGVKAAATLRTLPGSPIRASALDLAKGGFDEAFFGYWAIETHRAAGFKKGTIA